MGQAANNVKRIFLDAIEQYGPEQWPDYLDQVCGDDPQVRRRVKVLLEAHLADESLVDEPAIALAPSVTSPIAEKPGSRVGPYKLVEQIGEGGMGLVFTARQTEPVERTVALKVVKPGMDTHQVIARFEAERQALALMDHPNIAKILDAGATESGRPYFVMDVVQGMPVTEYCDQNELTTSQRLGIFLDICQAVQHAHQKGIIHRDLKPSNVLVTEHDGKPMPKIIDFGVAKATQQRLTEKTHFTEHRQLIGTPEYMSPEQATFCDADVDTRSDIYSLGVLLYELLVGTTPFDAQELSSRGYDEICRVIRESDAPTPSKRLSTLGEAASEISKQRHVEPTALRKLLRGDLDWIVMKCLEKDRSRRYETVHSLARDIERHLSDEPVRARPPSMGYQLRKLVRKHRVAAAATIAVLTALATGLALMGLGLARAKQAERVAITQRDQAQQNLQLASQLMVKMIWPATGRMFGLWFPENEQDVLQQARRFSKRVLQQAHGDPELRRQMAEMHRQWGYALHQAGQDPEPELRQSLSILTDLAREFPDNPQYRADLSEVHGWLSTWFAADLRLEEAAQQRRISLGILQDLVEESASNGPYRQLLIAGQYQMGRRLTGMGHFDEALKYHREALTDDGILAPWRRAESRENCAYLLLRLARYEEADQVLQEAVQIAEQATARDTSPSTVDELLNPIALAICENMAGLLDHQRGRFTEAEVRLRQAIDLFQQWFDDRPKLVWTAWLIGSSNRDLAEVLTAMGRLDEAEEVRHRSLAVWESLGFARAAAFPHGKALAHYRLGEHLHGTGRTDEARRQFVEAQAIMDDLATRRPNESICHWQLICLLANCPDPELRDPPRAVALAKRVLPKQAGHYWRYLALAQYRSDQWQDAADSVQQAMDLRQGGDAFDWLLLAMTHWQLGQKEEALKWYTKAQEAIAAAKPLFYEYIGVMAVQRLQREAEMLLGNRSENTKED